jgi:hypothetical protein
MIRWFKLGGGLLGACLVLSACGKSKEDPAAASPVALEQFAASFAQALCGNMAECCDGNSGFDQQHCEADAKSTMQASIDKQVTPETTYDAQAAGECLRVMAANATCGNTDKIGFVESCVHMAVGKLADGAACKFSAECKSGVCLTQGETGPGVCLVDGRAKHGKAGDECETTCDQDFPCIGPSSSVGCYVEDGLRCSLGKCESLHAKGEACFGSADCVAGLACVNEACAPKLEEGGSCSENEDCASGFCQEGTCTNGVTPSICKKSELGF